MRNLSCQAWISYFVCASDHLSAKISDLTRSTQGFRFSSRYVTNLFAILSSPQSTAPFSVVPSVIAFLCTVTNWRFSLCNSESVMFREGRHICGLNVGDNGRRTVPPDPWAVDCADNIRDTKAIVVCSRVCKASVGAFTVCQWNEVRMRQL